MRTSLAPILVISVLLAGCAATPEDYAGQRGADQALAKCRAQSNMSPAMANAQANPLFAAAMQQQYVNDCMKAAGYRLN
jgi:uncharacterized lipoprotein YajG